MEAAPTTPFRVLRVAKGGRLEQTTQGRCCRTRRAIETPASKGEQALCDFAAAVGLSPALAMPSGHRSSLAAAAAYNAQFA